MTTAAVRSNKASASPALIVLRDVGIAVAQIDATHWNPNQTEATYSRGNRAQAMLAAHEAAAYKLQVANGILASIDDSRPSIPHDAVMAEMDADSAAPPTVKRRRA